MARQKPSHQNELRKKPQKRLGEGGEETPVTPVGKGQELSVYRVELEMRNDELRRAQREIDESHARYLDLYENAPVGYLTFDEKGVVFELNLTAAHLLGVERSSLVKKPFSSLIVPEYQDAFYLHRRQVLDSGFKQTCELILRKDAGGSLFHAQLDSIARHANGVTAIRTILADITERKPAERELDQARQELEKRVVERTAQLEAYIIGHKHAEEALKERLKFETLLADISARFINVPANEVDGEILDAERRICELLDLDVAGLWQQSNESPGSFMLTHLYGSMLAAAPDYATSSEYFPWYQEQICAGRVVAFSTLDQFPAEAARDLEVSRHFGIKSNLTIPLSVGGEPPIGALAFSTTNAERDWPDILVKRLQLVAQIFVNALARKRTEQALQESEEVNLATFEQAGVGIAHIAVDGRLLRANDKLCAIVGYTREELLQRTLQDITYPDDREASLEHLRRVLSGTVKSTSMEKRCVRKDRLVVWVDVTVSIVRTLRDGPKHFIAVMQEITVRKVYETELKERLRFEQLLSDTSAILVGASVENIDHEIQKTLAAARQILRVDRCGLLRYSCDTPVLEISHVSRAEGLSELPIHTDLSALFPYLFEKLFVERKPCAFSAVDNLPAEASIDRQTLREWGVQSAIIVPIEVRGLSDHYMAVTRDRSEGIWPEEYLPRLRLLGEILLIAVQRALADKGLREGEAMLRSITSASPVGIGVAASDRIIRWVNEAVTHITGYRVDELTGQSSRRLYETEEEFLRVGEAICNPQEGRWPLNTRWVRKDGLVREVDVWAARVDGRDISKGIVVVAQDITERRQAEAAAAEAQSTITSILESTEDMIWTVDPQRFGLLTFNPALREYFRRGLGLAITRGMSPDEMVGGAFTPAVASKWREFYQRALSEGPFMEEYLVSAGTQTLLLSFSLLRRDGEVFGISVFGKDVTERKRMEENIRAAAAEWQATFDAVPDLIMVLDKDCRILRANRAAFSFFSEQTEKVVGSFCYTLMHLHEKQPPEACLVTAALKTKRHEEADLYDEERQSWFHISADPIVDESGEIRRIIHRVTNITDRKRSDIETFSARREMLRLERLLLMGELSASLAHELNQPLTAILSNARAAARFLEADRLTVEELKMILDDIVRDDKRAGDIIRSLRSMLRIEEGEVEITHTSGLLNEAIALFNSEAILRNIAVKTDIPASLPLARVNRVQIQQVVMNLMMNAAEAMEDQPAPRRKMIIRAAPNNVNSAVRVSVRDFGHGIDEADEKRLFEPFFTTKASGLGMGLSLSRSIVEAHGGHIWAENQEHGGAIFFFDLPIQTR